MTLGLDRADVLASRRPHLSRHARQRMKDRSIPPSIVEALLDFGERTACGEGAEMCFFTKRAWRRFSAYLGSEARHFERYRSTYAIVAGDGLVVTTCWRH